MKVNKLNLFILIILFGTTQTFAQNIHRRASLGITPTPMTEEIAKEKQLLNIGGILVNAVHPNSTALSIGVQENDIILKINGQETNTFPELVAARDAVREGSKMNFAVWRNGKEIQLQGTAKSVPKEISNVAEIIYDEIPYKGGWLRAIINKPNPGTAIGTEKHPTIFFIPGYTCASVDNLSAIHPYRKLVDSLSGLGYAIFRVEKPGIGDNVNTGDCFQMGFDNELEAYQVAYEFMKKYDFFDLENIFVLGHSMGGVYAPKIAAKHHPKGVIVYGTTHETWYEYLLRIHRYQNLWVKDDWIQNEKDVRLVTQMWYEHFYNKKTTKELAKNPDFKRILEEEFQWDGNDQILARDEIFWQELQEHNFTEAWANTNAYVLSLYGEADLAAISALSHEEIVKIVNHYHPGKGTFQLVPKTDHSMIKVGTMKEGVALSQSREYRQYLADHFNFDLITMINDWIQDKLEKS